ncbi:hypothetical protein SAMN05421636_103424 [Pricia antarctica]|uniref:Uncharacterized protein n=1 Tax=Pricia antarctica TaxID=641691 RepID=A0A1G7AKJ2_9FLAO|nr:hypothetical protein SAMN05421636_103424 [Pricia antarctica]
MVLVKPQLVFARSRHNTSKAVDKSNRRQDIAVARESFFNAELVKMNKARAV